MYKNRIALTAAIYLGLLLGALVPVTAFADADTALQEDSPDVVFLTTDAPDLAAEAATLKTPVAMYEYVKNNFEFALYQGSRGGSLNTFEGQRGNDVDTASALIAMLRSQNYPARYVVGTVKRDIGTVENWLGVKNPTLAYNLLLLQGIQQVQWVSGTNNGYIQFEQVWVEVLTHVDNYRGAGADQTPCSLTDTTCKWVPLAPAFKLRNSGGSIDVTGHVSFDYTGYYNAIKNNDPTMMNKNPLDIYEKEILDYLHTNDPGKTLADVEDLGSIKQEALGLLPLSLPFEIVGPVRRYNSVADHDAQVGSGLPESKPWEKYLYIDVYKEAVDGSGNVTNDTNNPLIIGQQVLLTTLATQQLTLTFSSCTGGIQPLLRLNGTAITINSPSTSNSCNTSGNFSTGTPLIVTLKLDGAPDPTGGTHDSVVQAVYINDVVGGYYLIGTGGDTSNWGQVHRAAAQLLQANQTYPVTYGTDPNNPSGPQIPYVGSTPLEDDPPAMDALTGGLLYTAMTLYYSQAHDAEEELGKLDHVVAPIDGWVGMVSSVGDVQYIDGTSYSIMPGGLLIDMKGVQFSSILRDDQPDEFESGHFELIGHIFSSYEHETWQELTGYDAISTVRGIQMALANGATLEDITTTGNFVSSYPAFGYNTPAPAPFSIDKTSMFGTTPVSWALSPNDGNLHGFAGLASAPTSLDALHQQPVFYWSDNGVDAFDEHVSTDYSRLSSESSTKIDSITYNGVTISEPAGKLLTFLQNSIYVPQYDSETIYPYLDRTQGFAPGSWVYTTWPSPLNVYDPYFMIGLRTIMYTPTDPVWGIPVTHELVLPSTRIQGPTYLFSVYLSKEFDSSGDLINEGYEISNQSYLLAGGGYVDGTQFVDPNKGTAGSAFNDAQLNGKTLTSLTNNNAIITPSTSDPVSTVTGNMYHDETDFSIRGRGGLDYTFTRTYNSNVAGVSGNGAPLSVGWTHSYNMQLTSNDYGQYPDYPPSQAPENGNGRTSSITYTDERGGQWNYLVDDMPDSSGNISYAITPPKGMFATLTMDIPVAGQTSVFQHALVFPNGVTYVFQGGDMKLPGNTAQLVQIQDAYGDQLNFGYTNGLLTSITDNFSIAGRTGLTLTYYTSGPNTGHLQTVSDWTGRTWTYAYDSSGNLNTVTNPLNQVTTYVYQQGTHLVAGVIRPAVRSGTAVETQFSYYRNDRAFNDSDALGDTETLDYDLFSKSTRVTDPRGFVATQYYDQNGSLTSLLEKDGGHLYFTNNPDFLRDSKQDALGYTTSYTYDQARTAGAASDTDGQVTQETDALGNYTQTDYGALDQPTRKQDKDGNQLFYDYYTTTNSSGAVAGKLQDIRVQSADAAEDGLNNTMIASYTYYPSGALATQTEYIRSGHTRTTTLTYYPGDLDVEDKWVAGTDGTSTHTHYTYDTLDRLKTETLYRTHSPTDPALIPLTTTWNYVDTAPSGAPAAGAQVSETDPIGNIWTTIYDLDGLEYQKQVQYLQPDGSYVTRTLSTSTYDAADRLIKRVDTDGDAVQFSYDAGGNLLTQTDPNGNVTHYEYDAMGRRTAVVDANGNRTETTYDLDGRVIAVQDGNGNTTTFAYDALGRKTSVVTQLGNTTKYAYDANGNVIGVQDADLIAKVMTPTNQDHDTISEYYDGLGRPTAVIDANNGELDKTYDLLGDVTTIDDPAGNKTTMVYDDLGRMITVEDPLSGTTGKATQYTYDQAGNVLTKTDRNGAVTQYFYDNLNRLYQTKFLADNTTETRTYNAPGDDMDTLSNANVTYTFLYDDMHRQKQVTDSRSSKTMSWTYDAAGNITQKTDFQDDVTYYQYDSTNRLIAESNKAYVQASYQYDGAGRLVSRILSSGARTLYSYDADNRLSNLSNYGAAGALLESLTYTRDPVGNITAITRQDSTGTSTTNYTYDTRYELTGVAAPSAAQSFQYTYDAVGNRTALFQANPNSPGQYTQEYGYKYDADNRLNAIDQGTSSTAVKTYGYDFDGQRISTSDGSGNVLQQIAWDQKGRIASVTEGTQTSTMGYDPNDYRISKQTTAATDEYYLEGKNLEAEYDGSGNLKEKYLRGAVVDELIYGYSYNSSGQATAATYHHDQVTSVTDETAPDGTVLASFQYDPFGNVISQSGTPQSALMYTGRNYDSDSGLYYYRARYYDPTIGRFISEDPLGFGADTNFYRYVGNRPLGYNDPDGRCPWCVVTALVGGVAAVYTEYATNPNATAGDYVRAGGIGLGFGYLTGLVGPEAIAAGAEALSATTGVSTATAATVSTMAVGAAGNVASDTANQTVRIATGEQSNWNYTETGVSAAAGAVGTPLTATSVAAAIPAGVTFSESGTLSLVDYAGGLPFTQQATVNLLGDTVAGTAWNVGLTNLGNTGFTESNSNAASGAAAAGGFVIYPNQLNLNSSTSVYAKP